MAGRKPALDVVSNRGINLRVEDRRDAAGEVGAEVLAAEGALELRRVVALADPGTTPTWT